MNKKLENDSAETRCSEANLNSKTRVSLSPMILVDEQDVINTYSEEEKFSCQKYSEYQKLVKENPAFGYKRCAKLLGVPQGRTRWWHTKGAKRAFPIPLKTINKLKSIGLLDFSENHPEAQDVFRILGAIFGDGNIDRNLNTMSFISSHFPDVERWSEDIVRIFPFAKEKMSLVEGGEYGHSFCIRTFDRSVIRFFVALGAPVGAKVANVYSLPPCIFSLPKEIRIAFLDGLFASEISVPVFRRDKRSQFNTYWKNFQFGLSKIDQLESDHRVFLDSVRKLSETVGVSFTPNIRKDTQKPSERKDGHLAFCYRIFLQTHFRKVISFNETFPLRYASDKKQRLEEEIKKAREYKTGSQKGAVEILYKGKKRSFIW